MSGFKRSINTLKNLNGKLFGVVFDNVVTELRESDGLSNEDISSLLSFVTDDKLRNCKSTSFKDLLFCCIPREPLTSNTIDKALLWMFYNVNNESTVGTKINAVLEWVSGLLEFNLIEKSFVDGYYEMYYKVLCREQCQRYACKLIHMLTRPEDVYRGRVEEILSLFRRSGKRAKHIAILIELFKTFKPELVPENTPSFSREVAFKSLSPGFQRSLEAAAQHMQAQNNQLLARGSSLDWTAVTSKKNKSGVPLIPSAMYVHLGSELYREKRHKVVDFLDKVALASYHFSCEIPTSILSLLLNEGGIHFLATHNSDVHARFSSVLFSCLNSVFFLNHKNVPFEEREHFLQQLVVLEDYMQQGIPVVSRFLAFYIAFWDGQEHQKHIYRLLERITISNFEEFNDCILTHLQTLFLAGSTEEKILIIKTLSELIYNMCVRSTKQIPKEHMFLGGKYSWETDFNATVPQLIRVVSRLCESGLLLTSNDPSLLHTSLSFFETLMDLQSYLKLELTIIPPIIFYRCLFSVDFCSLARACGLLLRYKLSGLLRRKEENVALINRFSCDVYNCLLNKKAFSKANQGYILEKHDELKQVIPFDADSAFSLEFHPTMLGLAQHMRTLNSSFDVVLSDEVLKDSLLLSFPELQECLSALEDQYMAYHSQGSFNS
ncbi:Centromere protein I [Frankliniella fusca]|uniref:Centromere protein I n=1 Tax=Frankliniella fusca TaxID=407009 RepID=A0AAE1L790_9NEOP|nr:Centromere protein I [Frankliniella fusca]